MNQLQAFAGTLNYEFRMQIRRRAVWITFLALGLIFTQFHQPWNRPVTTPVSDSICTGRLCDNRAAGHIVRRGIFHGLPGLSVAASLPVSFHRLLVLG